MELAKSIMQLKVKLEDGKAAFAKGIWRRYLQIKLLQHYVRQFKRKGDTVEKRSHHKLRHMLVFKGLAQMGQSRARAMDCLRFFLLTCFRPTSGQRLLVKVIKVF
jgi:hypothetical protein